MCQIAEYSNVKKKLSFGNKNNLNVRRIFTKRFQRILERTP